jgi:hypothetical protein
MIAFFNFDISKSHFSNLIAIRRFLATLCTHTLPKNRHFLVEFVYCEIFEKLRSEYGLLNLIASKHLLEIKCTVKNNKKEYCLTHDYK